MQLYSSSLCKTCRLSSRILSFLFSKSSNTKPFHYLPSLGFLQVWITLSLRSFHYTSFHKPHTSNLILFRVRNRVFRIPCIYVYACTFTYHSYVSSIYAQSLAIIWIRHMLCAIIITFFLLQSSLFAYCVWIPYICIRVSVRMLIIFTYV